MLDPRLVKSYGTPFGNPVSSLNVFGNALDSPPQPLGAAPFPGPARGSAGAPITHQVAAVRSEPVRGKYEVKPARPLEPREYALYPQRGEGLPAMLRDFSVRKGPRR